MSTDNEVLHEATALVSELSNGLVTLERSPNDEVVVELFRAAHSLKGNCAMAGIDGAATLAHAVEDLLAAVRSGDVVPSGTLVDGALDAVDDIEAILNAVEGGTTSSVDPEAMAATLRDRIEEQREIDSGIASPDTDATKPSGIDFELPEPDADLSAEEALERASVFDDLDSLAAHIDDDEAFAGLEGAGTFDAIEWDEKSSPAPDGESPPQPDRHGTEPDSGESSTGEGTDAVDDPFIWVKDETDEETDVDALQADIEDEGFGEFDDDDEVSIRELIEMDPDPGMDTEADGTDSAAVDETATTRTPDSGESSTDAVDDDPFIWVKDETDEETDLDALQADIEDEGFGEFDDDDEVSIRELIEMDPDPETEAASDGDSAAVDETVTTRTLDAAEDPVTEDGTDAVDDPFIWVKDETDEETDLDALQADIEDETFGEFDDDDEVSIRELIEMDLDLEADGPETSGESPPLGTSASTESAKTDVDALQADSEDEATGTPSAGDEDVPDEEILDVIGAIDLDQPEPPGGTHEFEREAGTAAFTEQFGGLFDVGSDGEGTTKSVGRIEDSTLDADRFRRETSVDTTSTGTTIHSLSVDVGTADDLLNLVGELSMTRLSVEDSLGNAVADEAEDALGALQSIEAEFRRSVMELRLMPLSPAFDGLSRVARDIARDQGKRLSFDVKDEDVKLDRNVVERISEPLVHLVRNAADHGIEPSEEREAAGKPAEGQIEIRAERIRDGAVIEVEDDGRGIDPDVVLTKGIEEGLVTQSEAEAMDDEDAYDLLFHHGLTTSEEVTTVSGRGVGMDIVARVCSDLDGSVEVESEPGEGTTVRLRLPVTVAMAKLLFVEAGGERYAIPTSDIEYVEKSDGEGTTDDRLFSPKSLPDWDEANRDEDDQYRLVRLDEAFDGPAPSTDEGVVVWLRPEIERVALYCDDIVESREAVVKPYGAPLDRVPGISGATMRENGDVINIIDAATLA
jgi:two-component system chemotaxis sensor kinase CheA